MGRDRVPADWPPITPAEAALILGQFPELAPPTTVVWASPRPLSAAAVLDAGGVAVFLKRHHHSVRSGAQLLDEHAFAAHLRGHGVAVPRFLVTATGSTVVERREWVYELQEAAAGVDSYRDVQSWEPYRAVAHARAAGMALALFHQAAAGYRALPRAPGVLLPTDRLVRADDPPAALKVLVGERPALGDALARWPWQAETARVLSPPLAAAAAALAGIGSQWAHGDWHPSNLTWSSGGDDATVVSVLDLGLVNRTSAVHDLAVALERAVIGWLDLEERGAAPVDLAGARALLDGYGSVRPLRPDEAIALLALLPVVHVDLALAEIEYFATVVHSPVNAELAYRSYLLGHAEWFAASPEAGLLRAEIARSCALNPG